MLAQGFSSEPTPAENTVLDEMAHIFDQHVEHWRQRRQDGDTTAGSPLLLQIDGPGRSLFLDKVAAGLDDDKAKGHWTGIRFDAWQFQRVAPPWWWLIKAIDDQLQERLESTADRRALHRWRRKDYEWRAELFRGDLVRGAPVLLVALVLAIVAWRLSGASGPVEILQWLGT